jgi:hypothetical protein
VLLIEFAVVFLAILCCFTFPDVGGKWLGAAEYQLARLARKRALSVVVIGFLALGLRLAVFKQEPIPEPLIHDEFGYLLAADTFAHGHIANPTHPMWIHFETFYVNFVPTYVTMFHPAPGLFLALGQLLFGHPFWGVWLSLGIMSSAICWALQGWLPPFWALLGGIIAVIRLGTFSYWADSYWGGAVPAFAGALILGAYPRIRNNQRLRDALLMALGFAILANSRPYEGLFYCIPIVAFLIAWMLRTELPVRTKLLRVALPIVAGLCLTAAAMMYYYWRTTGNPFQSPYFQNIARYNYVPYFPWQSIRPIPDYHHNVMRDFYTHFGPERYWLARNHPIWEALSKTILLWLFFLGPLLSLPIIFLVPALPYGLKPRDIPHRIRVPLLACLATYVAMSLLIYHNNHYGAPATAALYLLILMTVRRVRHWRWREQAVGRSISRSVPLLCIVLLFVRSSAIGQPDVRKELFQTWCSPGPLHMGRQQVISQLNNISGFHLVIVQYAPQHNSFLEWVFNEADIDNAKIVWARDMGPEKNQELIRYFENRHVWAVRPDANPPGLVPYDSASSTPPWKMENP